LNITLPLSLCAHLLCYSMVLFDFRIYLLAPWEAHFSGCSIVAPLFCKRICFHFPQYHTDLGSIEMEIYLVFDLILRARSLMALVDRFCSSNIFNTDRDPKKIRQVELFSLDRFQCFFQLHYCMLQFIPTYNTIFGTKGLWIASKYASYSFYYLHLMNFGTLFLFFQNTP